MITHVALDLETLGTKARSPIIAIGAAQFVLEPDYKLTGSTFYTTISWQSAMHERTPDADTLRWWMNQSEEAKTALFAQSPKHISRALHFFGSWFPENAAVWGNGSSFDVAMIEDCMHQYLVDIPWRYSRVFDLRTMKLAAEMSVMGTPMLTASIVEPPFTGTPHNALHDAEHQAKRIINYAQIIKG